MRHLLLAFLLLAAPLLANNSAAAASCPRQCLNTVLDNYLSALKARDPARVAWARGVKNTENNVALEPGDGLWATITHLGSYDFRFADPQAGAVGFYGVVEETKASSPFALRLKVIDGKIAEVETMVARSADAGVPFVTARETAEASLMERLAPAERSSQNAMIALANGYFDTLQRNDGTLHTKFSDTCNRVEDGMQTTNNPTAKFTLSFALSCTQQFKLGYFRFDDRLRSRRWLVVDEEAGLVMAGVFIDHTGHLERYTMTDGREIESPIRRPHSYCMLETFKIRNGAIDRIEAVFVTVPYRMPTPWLHRFEIEK